MEGVGDLASVEEGEGEHNAESKPLEVVGGALLHNTTVCFGGLGAQNVAEGVCLFLRHGHSEHGGPEKTDAEEGGCRTVHLHICVCWCFYPDDGILKDTLMVE